MEDITCTIIKPGATEKWKEIFTLIETEGFTIIRSDQVQLTKQQAEEFYSEHKGKPFFESLVKFMSSKPIVVAVLQKENAVEDFRTFIGDINPAKAKVGTLRKLYGTTIEQNAIHGSNSNKNAERESKFLFPKSM
ncbi:MAG: nucleoside-diphosphate kinase [candidate division SR1 bacterium]|nr:nucleoside-diphosphate kinase [candidate division SR1 bacterium]